MTSLLAHRGPDDEGAWCGPGMSLGHRRLSIIDLSDRGHQPMASTRGDVHIVYNGEVYNFAELRSELTSKGHTFRSDSDTEVILNSYIEWGEDCVSRFNGMFALAIWDQTKQELFIARDRIGITPLYWSVLPGQDKRLIFASEMKALLACPEVQRDIAPQSLYQYLGYEFVPAPSTIFTHIHKLAPGHCLTWKPGSEPSVRRYWRLEVVGCDRSAADLEEEMREQVKDAVQRRLVSDVPLGVFLSGGLDSSTLVAMMHKLGVDPLQTFSLHYEDASFSELEYARHVAETFGTQHHEIKIDPITPDMIETCCWHLDEPMTDLSAMPFYLLCKKVREHVTVCLSGEGVDELLVGYDRFKASKLNSYYSMMPRLIREKIIAAGVSRFADRPKKKGIINMLKRFTEGSILPEDGGHMRWQYFLSQPLASELFVDGLNDQIEFDPFGPIRSQLDGAKTDGRISREVYVDTCMTMPDSLLMKADKMSMAHGLEVRVPFLDHRFAEFCGSIPSAMKLEGKTTKAIFRSAMNGILPDRIRTRGKQGYSLPIKNWLRSDLKPYMLDCFESSPLINDSFDKQVISRLVDEHMSMKANHNHVLWALVNLATWHRIFIEDASTATANPSQHVVMEGAA